MYKNNRLYLHWAAFILYTAGGGGGGGGEQRMMFFKGQNFLRSPHIIQNFLTAPNPCLDQKKNDPLLNLDEESKI